MSNISHKTLVTTELHVPGYLQSGDPGAVGAGKYWIDTTLGTGLWALKVRNSTNLGWEATKLNEVINTLTGKTVLANNDVFLIEDSAVSYTHKKLLYSDMIAQLDTRYAGIDADGKVLASATDITPDYLDGKVDNDSIKVESNVLTLDSQMKAQLKSKIAVRLMEPQNTLSWSGCIMSDNTVRLWGSSLWSGLGINSTQMEIPSVPSVASSWDEATYGHIDNMYASYYHQYLVTSLGYVFGAGYNDYGQLAQGTTTRSYVFLLIKTGAATYLTNVVKMDTSHGSDGSIPTIMALTSTGKLYAWGYNGNGQCGQGHVTTPVTYATEITMPVAEPAGTTWLDMCTSSYNYVSCFGLTSTGKVYAWGNNGTYSLGLGDTTQRLTPTIIPSLTGIIQIGSGGNDSYRTSYALKSDGQMYAWGENGNGSIGDGSNTTRTTPVASTAGVSKFWVCKSYTTSVAARLSSTGSLVTWGYNNNGQCGRGDATNNKWSAGATGLTITVTDKVAWTHPSSQSSLHVVTGGTLWSCGYNGQGQLADGTNTVQYSFVASRGLMKNKIVDVTTWGAAGGCSIGVLDIDGNVYASGANDLGQLGVGNLVAKSILTKLPF